MTDGWNENTKTTDHVAAREFVKSLDDFALQFVLDDCSDAIDAMPDNIKAGHYIVIGYLCDQETRRRAQCEV